MSNIKAVAFDVDGTLYSEPRLYLSSISFALRYRKTISRFRALRATLHHPPPPPTPTGTLYQWQAQRFAEIAGIGVAEARQHITQVIYEQWIERAARTPLLPHVATLLTLLHQHGIPLAVLSDFPPERKLARWGVATLFRVALNSETCNRLKPHPRPFELLMQSLSLPPQEILYVGNSVHYDIQPAHELGFATAYYRDPLRTHRSAATLPLDTFIFSHYRALRHYLERLHVISI